MLLQPGQQFTIVRQLGLPSDVTTYYIQAVVRNSTTGNIISTINLTDRTNQRFTGVFQVPQDPLGFGYYLDITTYVYTDAGYSTLSDIYNVENVPYLVFDRLTIGRNSGGNGDSTDYEKIKKMIQVAVESIQFPEIPEQKEVDLSGILVALESLSKELSVKLKEVIKPSETALSDLKNKVDSGIAKIKEHVSSTVQSQQQNITNNTDLTPIHSHLEDVKNFIVNQSDLKASEKRIIQAIKSTEIENGDKLVKKVEQLFEKVDSLDHNVVDDQQEGKKVEEPVVSHYFSNAENLMKE
jgi:uncharacterized protein YlaN (UPF0358 family)